MRTNTKEHPFTEEPLLQVPQVRLFTLPEDTREVLWTDLKPLIISRTLPEIRQPSNAMMVNNHKIGLCEAVPVVLGLAQELPASVIRETPTTFVGGDHIAGRPITRLGWRFRGDLKTSCPSLRRNRARKPGFLGSTERDSAPHPPPGVLYLTDHIWSLEEGCS